MAYSAIKGAWCYTYYIICASDDLFRISVPVPVPVPAFHVFHLPIFDKAAQDQVIGVTHHELLH